MAAPIVVLHVRGEHTGMTKFTEINYDVEGIDEHLLTTGLSILGGTGGDRWCNQPARSLKIRSQGLPGEAKRVMWDAGEDTPPNPRVNQSSNAAVADSVHG